MDFSKILCSTLALCFSVVVSNDSSARPFRPGQMPNGNVFNCATCHISEFGGGPRNPFGQDVFPRVNPGQPTVFWGPELAMIDSDGDGFTNGEELLDPEGTWQQGDPQPGDPSLVTHPGDPDSKPAQVIEPAELPFMEDFESAALGESIEEEVSATGVWTNQTFNGWSVDNSGVVGADQGLGVDEWIGWTFADKNWWADTAGDQQRTLFTNASGVVAVADPDEWDDIDSPGSQGTYTSFLSTPPINVSGAAPESILLTFDSSWRDEDTQAANITVTFDSDFPEEILFWSSDPNDPAFHDDAPNETVNIEINNPAGASEMVITFGMLDATNDWWWAIDNVQVTESTKIGTWELY